MMYKDAAPKMVKLEDYKKPDYLVDEIELTFDLHETETHVYSKMHILSNHDREDESVPLVLNGEEMKLIKVSLNGKELNEHEYKVEKDSLTLFHVPAKCIVEIENVIDPLSNKALEGLYKSGHIFCTQNEPEGFRRITYYIDRPDNMAKFKTKIIGDKKLFPYLLSNGNPIRKGDLGDGKHFVEWEDPFRKPSYLFALVAGDLGVIRDEYVTSSGRKVLLEIYCDKGNEYKCHYAMESLKRSMKWDEDRFGLEYDLDIYMIVAVDSFNMGAMENKGLNIFNSAYVLADPKTATDQNFYGIESVIGHEYFHNWSGNRVTCRDWFQLTLKEGLTVFRDQEFSADLNSRHVERINSVQALRSRQFAEDHGPTAHPIKPESYMEINNFYTATVYEKGAEVIRMIQTLLGRDGFTKGLQTYFKMFDGQAVRTEDFLHAMSVANDHFDFSQFRHWYSQAGTPKVKASWMYDVTKSQLTLKLEQFSPELPGSVLTEKKPFHIPLNVAIVDSEGRDIEETIQTLHLKDSKQEFVFKNIPSRFFVSLNRGFGAPIKLETQSTLDDLLFLMGHDSDSFNRYEAHQQVAMSLMKSLIYDVQMGKALELDERYISAWGKILKDTELDNAFKSLCLSLPEEGMLHQEQNPILFKETHQVRDFIKKTLALVHKESLLNQYHQLNAIKEYNVDAKSMGDRNLKHRCLEMLAHLGTNDVEELVLNKFMSSTNMTDEFSSLNTIIHSSSKNREYVLKSFYEKWKHETLVMQKWLSAQAIDSSDETYLNVLKLEYDAVYDRSVPNLVRSLFGSFARNYLQFHHESGRGYRLLCDKIIELDPQNPSMASRLASAFTDYKRLPQHLQLLMKKELESVLDVHGLSKNTYEIVSKILS